MQFLTQQLCRILITIILFIACISCVRANSEEYHICGHVQKFYIDNSAYNNDIGILFKEIDSFDDGESSYERKFPRGTYKFKLGKEQIGVKKYADLLEGILRNMENIICIQLHAAQRVVVGMTIPD